jgi:4-amino-4-deoxychorismate lyase
LSDFHVFTTLLVRNGQAQFLDEHLERLTDHARHFGIPQFDKGVFQALVEQNTAGGPHLLRIAVDREGELSATARKLSLPTSYEAAPTVITGIKVESQLATYKTSENSPYREAKSYAQGVGAFEALLIDGDGHIVDGSRSSPLLFESGELVSLEGGLTSITREKVLAEAIKLGIHTRREKRKAPELSGAILVAGSGVGLVPSKPIHDPRIKLLVDLFRLD